MKSRTFRSKYGGFWNAILREKLIYNGNTCYTKNSYWSIDIEKVHILRYLILKIQKGFEVEGSYNLLWPMLKYIWYCIVVYLKPEVVKTSSFPQGLWNLKFDYVIYEPFIFRFHKCQWYNELYYKIYNKKSQAWSGKSLILI